MRESLAENSDESSIAKATFVELSSQITASALELNQNRLKIYEEFTLQLILRHFDHVPGLIHFFTGLH